MKKIKVNRASTRDRVSAGVFKDLREVRATVAKNHFGEVMAEIEGGRPVVIVKYKIPAAVIVPVAEYERLATANARRINVLSRQFDAMLARMQTPEARAAMSAAFHANPAADEERPQPVPAGRDVRAVR